MKNKKILINENQFKLLFESENFSNNIKFQTSGDYDIEIEDLNNKLNIINNYFPFKTVSGEYDEDTVDLDFDNGMKIFGTFNGEPFTMKMIINQSEYYFDIHPFGQLGSLDKKKFEQSIQNIYKEENMVSVIIVHDNYASATVTIDKKNLHEYSISIVKGTQIPVKIIGKTILGKSTPNIVYNFDKNEA